MESEAERPFSRQYHDFRARTRRDLFLSIAVFCYYNRPIEGYYFEFGGCAT